MLSRKQPVSIHSLLPAALVGLSALPIALVAYPAQAEPATPTVDKIINDFIAATGGKTAYLKVTSTETKGTFTLQAQKITADVVTKAKAPDKIYVSQIITGIGKFESGYDGKIGWSRDPLHGLRTLSGNELEQLRAQARFNAPLHWKEIYSKSEMLGVRTVNGAKAYAIRFIPANGQPSTQYYDVKTKLLARVDQIVEQPEGKIPSESYLSDYRVVDGIKEPFNIRQVATGIGEATITTTKIQNNTIIDDAIFAKPAGEATPAPKPAK